MDYYARIARTHGSADGEASSVLLIAIDLTIKL
jgi:hypothetical protein